MEVIFRSRPVVLIRFFRQMGAQNFWWAGRWLYYALYWMLVLTSGGVLLMDCRPSHRLGAFRLVCWMMDLIDVEFTCSGSLGCMDDRGCPYHYDLCSYVGLAVVRVLRVCWRQLGGRCSDSCQWRGGTGCSVVCACVCAWILRQDGIVPNMSGGF